MEACNHTLSKSLQRARARAPKHATAHTHPGACMHAGAPVPVPVPLRPHAVDGDLAQRARFEGDRCCCKAPSECAHGDVWERCPGSWGVHAARRATSRACDDGRPPPAAQRKSVDGPLSPTHTTSRWCSRLAGLQSEVICVVLAPRYTTSEAMRHRQIHTSPVKDLRDTLRLDACGKTLQAAAEIHFVVMGFTSTHQRRVGARVCPHPAWWECLPAVAVFEFGTPDMFQAMTGRRLSRQRPPMPQDSGCSLAYHLVIIWPCVKYSIGGS